MVLRGVADAPIGPRPAGPRLSDGSPAALEPPPPPGLKSAWLPPRCIAAMHRRRPPKQGRRRLDARRAPKLKTWTAVLSCSGVPVRANVKAVSCLPHNLYLPHQRGIQVGTAALTGDPLFRDLLQHEHTTFCSARPTEALVTWKRLAFLRTTVAGGSQAEDDMPSTHISEARREKLAGILEKERQKDVLNNKVHITSISPNPHP